MTEPVTVKYDLADILTRIEDKLDKQSEEIGNIKVKLTAVEIELKGVNKRLEAVEGTQKNQVWALIILLGRLMQISLIASILFRQVLCRC